LPTNEDGEFELILGNRQLLSVFFIVVILLGVFFTMGYIVGRNSSPVTTADATPARKSDTKPLVVESPTASAPEPAPEEPRTPRETAPPAPISTAQQQPEIPKPPKSEPVKAPPKFEPSKAAKAEKAEKDRAEKERADKERADRADKEKAKPAPASISATPSGTYLQLAATTKREADIMVDVLRQKKFGALAAEIPEKPRLFRVLVGPMQEAQVNKTKTDLQSAGFPGDKSIKRSF
jgi:type IV secretory pathway VirB10-like protein